MKNKGADQPEQKRFKQIWLEIEGSLVPDLQGALCCVLELSLVLVQARKTENCPNMTEKLLTGN